MCEADTDGESSSDAESSPNASQLYQNTNNTQEAILSVFGLTEVEIRAYVAVIEHPDSTAKYIANDVLDRHPHHISRSLRNLSETGLVERSEKAFDTGGVGYVYSPLSPEETEQYFQNQLSDWIDDACSEIDRLDSRIDLETTVNRPLCEQPSGTGGTTNV
jgi:predicted transcriptional regulator